MYEANPNNYRRKLESPHDSTTTSHQTNPQSRNTQGKMHYSEGGRIEPNGRPPLGTQNFTHA